MNIDRKEAREWIIGGKDVLLTMNFVNHTSLTVKFIGEATDAFEFERAADRLLKNSIGHKWSVDR
jgi:hypothetical protein